MLEILVSAMMLALVLLGLANIFAAAKRYVLHSRSWMTAGELSRYFLDRLQMDVRQDQWGSNCLSTNGTNTNCDTTSQSIDNISYTPQYEKSQIAGTTLRKVRLTINWQEPSL